MLDSFSFSVLYFERYQVGKKSPTVVPYDIITAMFCDIFAVCFSVSLVVGGSV